MPFQHQNQAFPPPNPLPSSPHQRNLSPFSSQPQSLAAAAAGAGAGERVSQPESPSPWQRMKWTDGMVRLLVFVVHSAGDDVAGVDCPEQQQKGKKSPTSSSSSSSPAAGMQLKKGKWKSVSKAMMEKGFYVSPQQCEDKFNDLNKRYKRVNELLGKGTACKIVENPSLLDSMDYLPRKAMEEARKLLSSKHLFFREMCAYHNSSFNSASPVSPATIKIRKGGGSGSLCAVEEESGHFYHEDEVADDEEEEEDVMSPAMSPAAAAVCLSLTSPAQGEERWLRMKAAELEERRVVYENRAVQIEKQRFKWLRFSSNKEREMEKTRLRNERLRLENERLLLILQEKEIRLFEYAGNDGGGANGSYQFTAADHRNQN